MARYWAVALIVTVVAVLWAVRRAARQSQAGSDDEHRSRAPHGDSDRPLVELDPHAVQGRRTEILARDDLDDLDDRGDLDVTAPAVLSPTEWTPPRSASNQSRR